MGIIATDEAAAESLELLPLALARPREALARARALLAAAPRPLDASVAHQAAGIVLRDFGDINAAVAELRMSVRQARAGHSAERLADARAALGTALVLAGRTKSGLANLDLAFRIASGAERGRVLLRRGISLSIIGRHQEALAEMRRARVILRRAGDQLFEAR